MRILLDECLPKRLAAELSGFEAATVPAAGYAGLQNGELLRGFGGNFDAFITIDGNLASQQNIDRLRFWGRSAPSPLQQDRRHPPV
jgi:hypothetical protein